MLAKCKLDLGVEEEGLLVWQRFLGTQKQGPIFGREDTVKFGFLGVLPTCGRFANTTACGYIPFKVNAVSPGYTATDLNQFRDKRSP
jgi:hypothetical protein